MVEALTNVVRHASCDAAHVDLTVDQEGLHVRVDDTGESGAAPWRDGVGMASMRELKQSVEAERQTSTISSTSTAALRGRTATPTAARAC